MIEHTEIVMGIPITVKIMDAADKKVINKIFKYFKDIDARYSPYKKTSELTAINNGLPVEDASAEMQYVLSLCKETKELTNGYFNINNGESIDPSGLVKGWAIQNAANQLWLLGFENFFIEAGGDVAVSGLGHNEQPWTLGIRNPFDINKIVKTLIVTNCGAATSGTYIRGDHIYNPKRADNKPSGIQSITVIGPNIYEADRFATAAFAMGSAGIEFIKQLEGFEAYMIDDQKTATYTPGFEKYVA